MTWVAILRRNSHSCGSTRFRLNSPAALEILHSALFWISFILSTLRFFSSFSGGKRVAGGRAGREPLRPRRIPGVGSREYLEVVRERCETVQSDL